MYTSTVDRIGMSLALHMSGFRNAGLARAADVILGALAGAAVGARPAAGAAAKLRGDPCAYVNIDDNCDDLFGSGTCEGGKCGSTEECELITYYCPGGEGCWRVSPTHCCCDCICEPCAQECICYTTSCEGIGN